MAFQTKPGSRLDGNDPALPIELGKLFGRVACQHLVRRFTTQPANQRFIRHNLAVHHVDHGLEGKAERPRRFRLAQHDHPAIFFRSRRSFVLQRPAANARSNFWLLPGLSTVQHVPSWKKSFSPPIAFCSSWVRSAKPIVQSLKARFAIGSEMMSVTRVKRWSSAVFAYVAATSPWLPSRIWKKLPSMCRRIPVMPRRLLFARATIRISTISAVLSGTVATLAEIQCISPAINPFDSSNDIAQLVTI